MIEAFWKLKSVFRQCNAKIWASHFGFHSASLDSFSWPWRIFFVLVMAYSPIFRQILYYWIKVWREGVRSSMKLPVELWLFFWHKPFTRLTLISYRKSKSFQSFWENVNVEKSVHWFSNLSIELTTKSKQPYFELFSYNIIRHKTNFISLDWLQWLHGCMDF